MKTEVIDARTGDHILADGKRLRLIIKEKIHGLEDAYKALLLRMNNELQTKEEAVTLMVALHTSAALNEKALFFRACVERAAYLETEIKELNTIGQSFMESAVYKITLQDAMRFGV